MKKILFHTLFATASLIPFVAQADGGNSSVGVGVEGFYDRYREPGLMEDSGTHGSITGYYRYDTSNLFGALDGRVSYGTSDYESDISGSSSGTPEWEFEGRGRLGFSFTLWGGTMSPYTGLGARYFLQQGKGYFTTNFAGAYDRRIFQTYIPIGASYTMTTEGGWTITPQAEFDLLLYGDVNSRLSNVGPTYYNVSNTQELGSGYGIRSELMFGKSASGYAWQAGPFVRYWKVNDSEVTYDPSGTGWIEPKNDRIQGGVAVRVLW